MIPDAYREFFVASAGVTGALIGLLFVAVSVSTERSEDAATRVEFQSRSAAALLVFTNALLISMAALVPGVSLGWWAIASGAVVLTFAIATIRSTVTVVRPLRANVGWVWLVVGLFVIAGCELYVGVQLVRAFHPDAVRTLSYVVIGDLAFGIARAWQLVGLRDTGVVTSLRILLGREAHSSPHVDGERPAT
ncbi:hypothetical protein H7J06_03060 [Mycobacterium hodleri]|uniref:hypothetical protein n=1 Tax=Mycolicibacterium hodleri TaxID=49897 RepID=UPI0021F33EA0|nr:hypothetical protein [Mycolicibacterium hodleri]MCV7131950.1 hypothetical protein [Mycolicibacterium hodleri]